MNFLLEQLDKKFNRLQNEEELEEVNVTSNMDGGAGPIKTPNAFSKSKDENDLDSDHIEVFGYKKPKKTKLNTESTIESRLENLIEATYLDFKNDNSLKTHQKINTSIKEINRLMYEIELVINRNAKLKSETGEDVKIWKSTRRKFGKITERMLNLAYKLKDLGA